MVGVVGVLRRQPGLTVSPFAQQIDQPYATLTGSRAVNDPSGTNVVQIIIAGS